jgi:hypothetical protein
MRLRNRVVYRTIADAREAFSYQAIAFREKTGDGSKREVEDNYFKWETVRNAADG